MVKCPPKYSATDLNKRIVLQRKSKESDGMGGNTESWYNDATLWAMWMPMSGGQRFNAMRAGSEVRVKAVIRYRANDDGAPYYSASDRVEYLGRRYGIDAVIDVNGERRFLELMLTESAPS